MLYGPPQQADPQTTDRTFDALISIGKKTGQVERSFMVHQTTDEDTPMTLEVSKKMMIAIATKLCNGGRGN